MSRYHYFENYILETEEYKVSFGLRLDELVGEWMDKKKPVSIKQYLTERIDITDEECDKWLKTGVSPKRKWNSK